ncbi:MAG: LytR C-terminal domain-containing protein [Micrococcales bacterium]
MAEKFPQDEFAAAPSHGGRHRRLRTGRHRAAEFLKLALISAVLATIALVGLKVVDGGNLFTSEPNSPATIAVLDGSQKDLSSAVATRLVDGGFEVETAAKLIDQTNPDAVQPVTQVYAESSAYLDKAKEVAKFLGVAEATVNTNATAPITVLVGADYK